jgi:beta-N-acetylhexosaminidase
VIYPAKFSRRAFLMLVVQSIAVMALSPIKEIRSASLDVKIGQMLMVGFRGLEVDNEHFIVQDIRDRHVGGVVLFDYDVPTRQPVRNIESPSQVKALIASLKSVSATPLLVAIDQEGGIVARLKERHGFPPTVSHQHLGELNDLQTTYKQTALIAKTLEDLGINLNLAPVVDLCVNPDNPIIARHERCFSADPLVVTHHALQFIRAHHEQGVLCALKHFPGHGSSRADSHRGLTDVTDTWSRVELEPYVRIIGAGQADAIMTAHVFITNLDDKYPATLSQTTIRGILREDLNYDGVVISDDMQMGAIVNHYGFEKAIQKAIEAGVDILVFANNSVYEEDVAARAIDVIRKLVQAGTISEARIDESYRRIQRLKSRLSVRLAGRP